MNDHNLDDLIIDTIAPKNNKTKDLLTIIALFIVVLIVAIILTKTLLKSPDNDELVFEENISETIAPELKLQETSEDIKVAKPETELSLPTIMKEKITTPEEIEKPTIPEKENTIVKTKKETITIAEELSKLAIKEVAKPKAEVQKPIKKPIPVKNPTKTTISETYYVQVGSFKENPSPHFLSIIKNSGFIYHVTNPDRTGYKKLLIGPYRSRAEVDKARDTIRNRIHKSAFVVKK